MRFHHRAGNGEPKTGAARFSMGHEWLEKPGQHLRRNANSGIGNAKHNLILHKIGGDGENSAADHRRARAFSHARMPASEPCAIQREVPGVTYVRNRRSDTTCTAPQSLPIKLLSNSTRR